MLRLTTFFALSSLIGASLLVASGCSRLAGQLDGRWQIQSLALGSRMVKKACKTKSGWSFYQQAKTTCIEPLVLVFDADRGRVTFSRAGQIVGAASFDVRDKQTIVIKEDFKARDLFRVKLVADQLFLEFQPGRTINLRRLPEARQ